MKDPIKTLRQKINSLYTSKRYRMADEMNKVRMEAQVMGEYKKNNTTSTSGPFGGVDFSKIDVPGTSSTSTADTLNTGMINPNSLYFSDDTSVSLPSEFKGNSITISTPEDLSDISVIDLKSKFSMIMMEAERINKEITKRESERTGVSRGLSFMKKSGTV